LSILYRVKFTSSNQIPAGSITLPADIANLFSTGLGGVVTLSAGNRLTSVKCLAPGSAESNHTVTLSQDVCNDLLLPVPTILNLAITKDGTVWRLGPLIGIFANRFNKLQRPFGEQTGFFRKLCLAAHKLNALCYVFSPEDIDWTKGIIKGWIPTISANTQKEWVSRFFPMPDVVFDRGLFPRNGQRKTASQTRRILRSMPGIKIFNPAFFGKWKTHQLLSKHETLFKHLPQTKLLTNMEDIHSLVSKWGTVFLKPSGGSSGKGIIRVTLATSGYELNFRTGGITKTLSIKDLKEMEQALQPIIGNRCIIIQQGLKLTELDGHPFDIRLLMQKNRQGNWLRTGMAVRIAGPGNFISNLHAGGRAEKFSAVLPQVFSPPIVKNIRDTINRLSGLIASWVSDELHPLFGEIAIDFGIDEKGVVWIIELNAIPGRSIFRRIKVPSIVSRAISLPIEYACFLSGFAPTNTK
jgi:hypothetical protein